jgi:hypothetical protein
MPLKHCFMFTKLHIVHPKRLICDGSLNSQEAVCLQCNVYFCVLCLIVAPMPLGKNPFSVQLIIIINNNK